MDAPLLVDVDKGELDAINFDPLRIAEKELDSGVLPISVNRPMPEKKEEPIEDIKIDESVPSDASKIAKEKEITKEIAESGTMEHNDEAEEKPIDKAKAELE